MTPSPDNQGASSCARAPARAGACAALVILGATALLAMAVLAVNAAKGETGGEFWSDFWHVAWIPTAYGMTSAGTGRRRCCPVARVFRRRARVTPESLFGDRSA